MRWGCYGYRIPTANTGEMEQVSTDDGTARIVFGPEAHGLVPALAALCEIELAVDIHLRDGSVIGGVLAEIVSEHLALRGFDDASVAHTDELFLVPIGDISCVEVP